MYYENRRYYDTLTWRDIFPDEESFISKIEDIGGISDPDKLAELYEILVLKYITAKTRYDTEFPFILALRRELQVEFPYYLEKKALAKVALEMEIDEIRKQSSSLRNIINTHDEPINNASEVPIDDLSTTQESLRITGNKLDAVKSKYNTMNRNFVAGIYKNCDGLFRVILSDDIIWLYPQGGK